MFLRATLLLGLAAILGAAEGEPPIHVGLQATLASPGRELRNVAPGSGRGGGLFFEQDLDARLSLRTRLDFLAFGQAPAAADLVGLVPAGTQRVTASLASLGAELRLRPWKELPCFLLGGLCAGRLEVKAEGPGGTAKRHTSPKAGLALGAGCRVLPSASFTVRATFLPVAGATLGTLEAGLEYRF